MSDEIFLVVLKGSEEMTAFNDAYDRLPAPRPRVRAVCGDRIVANLTPNNAYERVLVQDGTLGFPQGGRGETVYVTDVAAAFADLGYDVREFGDVDEALGLLATERDIPLPFDGGSFVYEEADAFLKKLSGGGAKPPEV